LLVALALFVPLILVIWLVGREMGIYRAEDAEFYAKPEFVDRLSRDLGAQILDVKARGKMADKL